MSQIHTEHGHEAHEEHAGLDKKKIWQVFHRIMGVATWLYVPRCR